jgi:hypothetical protein
MYLNDIQVLMLKLPESVYDKYERILEIIF